MRRVTVLLIMVIGVFGLLGGLFLGLGTLDPKESFFCPFDYYEVSEGYQTITTVYCNNGVIFSFNGIPQDPLLSGKDYTFILRKSIIAGNQYVLDSIE